MSELLGADADVLDRNADSLRADAQRVEDIRSLAQRAVSELQGCWQGSDLIHLLQQWEQQTSPLLAAASAALDTCAVRLRAQSTAQRATSDDGGTLSGGGYGGALSPLLALVTSRPPPGKGSPADNATWWRSLGSQQQQQVINLHPDWIGNRDGVSFSARDQANRSLLTVHQDRLEARERRLSASLGRPWRRDIPNGELAALGLVRDKLASLDAIGAILARPGERQLLLLDLGSERAEAAIANGNVETADNVAVFVPGLSANVQGMSASVQGSMMGYDLAMSEMQKKAEDESRNARAHQSAATVTWIGYQAPQKGWDLVGATSVASFSAATNGAAKLVPFLQGVNASRSGDAHLTLLAHSYGSTTAGLALRQDTGVNDAVFFGSPGLGTDDVKDLKLASATPGTAQVHAGRLHYLEAPGDRVGDFGRFGRDPSLMGGMDHPSTEASTVVDPLTGKVRHFEPVTGHSDYLADRSTSQYNMSVIVADLPDRRVHSPGLDAGDALRVAAEVLPLPPELAAARRLAGTLARR